MSRGNLCAEAGFGVYEVHAMKHNVFKRLKDFQIGEPIWQPVIFAVLIILISVTLYFIQQM